MDHQRAAIRRGHLFYWCDQCRRLCDPLRDANRYRPARQRRGYSGHSVQTLGLQCLLYRDRLRATPFAYQWKKGGVDLVDGGNISGATTNILTLAAITRANEGSYTAGVTNSEGGAISSAGVLTVLVPPPTFSTVKLAGTDLVLSFTSTNIYDTTNAFILQSSPVVEGPYTNSPASFIFTNNAFQVTVPEVGGNMFYRLLHVE